MSFTFAELLNTNINIDAIKKLLESKNDYVIGERELMVISKNSDMGESKKEEIFKLLILHCKDIKLDFDNVQDIIHNFQCETIKCNIFQLLMTIYNESINISKINQVIKDVLSVSSRYKIIECSYKKITEFKCISDLTCLLNLFNNSVIFQKKICILICSMRWCNNISITEEDVKNISIACTDIESFSKLCDRLVIPNELARKYMDIKKINITKKKSDKFKEVDDSDDDEDDDDLQYVSVCHLYPELSTIFTKKLLTKILKKYSNLYNGAITLRLA